MCLGILQVTTTIKYPNWDVETMGIYVISRDVLIKLLQEDFPQAYDFRTEVIHGAISLGMKVSAMFLKSWKKYIFFDCYN